LRFFLDHDVDSAVAVALRAAGHEAWTAAEAGLSRVADDYLTVYAQDRGAVLITHDRAFSQRRRRNVIGRHMQLRCNEWDAAVLISERLGQILPVLEARQDVFIVVSKAGVELAFGWSNRRA
jgi:predicted nuclease of predicted toxin-antitoxin system